MKYYDVKVRINLDHFLIEDDNASIDDVYDEVVESLMDGYCLKYAEINIKEKEDLER